MLQDSLTGVVRILDFGSAVFHARVMGEEGRGAHVPMSCTPGFRSPESLVSGYRSSFEVGGILQRRMPKPYKTHVVLCPCWLTTCVLRIASR